jgi:hypothetical protein
MHYALVYFDKDGMETDPIYLNTTNWSVDEMKDSATHTIHGLRISTIPPSWEGNRKSLDLLYKRANHEGWPSVEIMEHNVPHLGMTYYFLATDFNDKTATKQQFRVEITSEPLSADKCIL